jgi:hypothetical protein
MLNRKYLIVASPNVCVSIGDKAIVFFNPVNDDMVLSF